MVSRVLAAAALLLLGAVALAQQYPPEPTSTIWFDQRVNHFDYSDTRTFRQQILIYDTDWNKAANGPIFFYTGNEGPIGEFYNNTGFMFENAPGFGALVVFAEHRYYGESLPFSEHASFTDSGIHYLTVEQALADYAAILTWLKGQYSAQGSPVVAFGGSYGGMLAAWFRLRYPYIVDMALAGSAPILMASSLTPNPGFYQAVTNDFAAVNEECPGLYRDAFSEILQLAESQSGLAQITETFSLCSALEPEDVNQFLGWAITAFANLAMADYPYPACFLGCMPAWPVTAACNGMVAASSQLVGLADTLAMIYGDNYQCYNITSEFVQCSDATGCGVGPPAWAWSYQACTMFLYFPSTNNVTDMFPPRAWTLANVTAYCQERWGLTPEIGTTTLQFGGPDVSAGSHIIFSNGLLDPWHGGGFLESISDTLVAVQIAEGAHHADLRYSNPADPPSLTEARATEVALLTQWLQEVSLAKAKRAEL